ncbi:MAG: thioredoxin family protein [Limisphaerales bacterium]
MNHDTQGSMNESPGQLSSSGNPGTLPDRKGKFHFWQCFWLAFLVVSLAFAWYSFYVPTNDIDWADSYPSAQLQAADSGKSIILYFTGEWCVPCRVMKRQVWADEEVKMSVNAQFIPVAIDVGNPDNAATLARYNVRGAPVTIITDPQGNALRWRAGRIGKSEFLELLKVPYPLAELEL